MISLISPAVRWGRMLPFVVLAACGTAPTGSSRAAEAGASLIAAPAADPAGIRQVIDRNNARLIQTFVAGDAAAAAELFADDAVLMLNGVPQIRGKAAIEQALAGFFTAVKYRGIVANVQEVQFFGDYALEMGTTVMTYDVGGQTVTDHGKYLVAWQRQPGGEWKIHRDVSNVSGAAQ
ncbi:MAG TPA: nuclear transport factor 2 family protein [Longimicrobium sp.]|nr:nuclear transport factor 2 family protein [Longimicrobium sp.]